MRSFAEYEYNETFAATNISSVDIEIADPESNPPSLKEYCFFRTFADCPNLLEAYVSLKLGGMFCCSEMFNSCKSLEKISGYLQSSNDTSHTASACRSMFENCTSLKSASQLQLPVIVPIFGCYAMFRNCTSLYSCAYNNYGASITIHSFGCAYMYENCSSLIDTPIISGTLYQGSYNYAFRNCTSLYHPGQFYDVYIKMDQFEEAVGSS